MNVIKKMFTTVIAVAVLTLDAQAQEAIDEFSAPAAEPKGLLMLLGGSLIILAAIAFIAITKSKRTKQD